MSCNGPWTGSSPTWTTWSAWTFLKEVAQPQTAKVLENLCKGLKWGMAQAVSSAQMGERFLFSDHSETNLIFFPVIQNMSYLPSSVTWGQVRCAVTTSVTSRRTKSKFDFAFVTRSTKISMHPCFFSSHFSWAEHRDQDFFDIHKRAFFSLKYCLE